jgi:hypothetical protein
MKSCSAPLLLPLLPLLLLLRAQGRLVDMALTTLQNLQEDGPTDEEVDTLRRIETFEWVSWPA